MAALAAWLLCWSAHWLLLVGRLLLDVGHRLVVGGCLPVIVAVSVVDGVAVLAVVV